MAVLVISQMVHRESRVQRAAARAQFSGTVWTYLGWPFSRLSPSSPSSAGRGFTAWMRWICRTSRARGAKSSSSVAAWNFCGAHRGCVASIFIIPIPWVYRWMSQWLASQTVGRAGTRTPKPHLLAHRASWATARQRAVGLEDQAAGQSAAVLRARRDPARRAAIRRRGTAGETTSRGRGSPASCACRTACGP